MKKPEFSDSWTEDVKALYKHDMEEYWDRTLVPNKWNQYKNSLDTYLSMADSDVPLDILDVGCAQATLALLLAERGNKVVAIDLRQESLDYAQSRYQKGDIRFLRHNVLELQLEEKFDLIYANQLIEHLVYPLKTIECLSSMLKPEGKLVIATPNHSYITSNHPTFTQLGDPKDWEHKQFSADGDGHFFAYTEQELRELFASGGLTNVSSKMFETPMISGHLKIRFLHSLIPYSVLKIIDQMLLAVPLLRRYLSHQLVVTGNK